MNHLMNANNPITEDDIANFLIHTPAFFERHAEVLTAVQMTSPHGNRAVSLQERQAEMLREKIKGLEHRIMDMIRHGNENVLIADKLQRWARSLLRTRAPAELPQRIVAEVQAQFGVPQAALKVWGVTADYAGHGFAQGVSDDAKSFASSLTAPFCGVNPGFDAVQWLPEPAQAMSVVLMPLRVGELNSTEPAFGMLVLASPDPQRFESGMGTDFLERIAELASAALSRLQ
ncbi:DUF484 family protein [Pseudorhodoferax sp. Leaf265]|jgi:uncharacterized protein YigA (DUF484 family)|uniref:DUF484 family protein n=1 Tax=Pseudorhodoferax sp. Leaf265 TaxID=1736315 RepID=UPI0006F634E2|nr:DUF484 family protein [Pseudorhodoferax sp. Leaf265]KQP16139.1 hypothetical protein ASF45_06220 [Pseudorhodoferax sp. Leaf265]